jgi:hypothetical protein
VGVTKGVVLVVWRLIGDNLLPPRLGKSAGQDVKPFLPVELAVLGRVPGARDPIENALRRGGEVGGFPAFGEVGVPVF